jgi:hypothetical protein
VEKENTYDILPLFNIFLNACVSTANLQEVECCLEKMEPYLLGKSEITYCELLKVCTNYHETFDMTVHDLQFSYAKKVSAYLNFLK